MAKEKTSDKIKKTSIASGVDNVRITAIAGRAKTYKVTCYLPGRKQVSKTVEGLSNARKMARELAATAPAIVSKRTTGKPGITLTQAVERYLRAGAGVWSPKTLRSKEYILRRYVLDLLGSDILLTQITPLDVQTMQDTLRDRLAATTCKQVMLQATALFSQLVRWQVIPSNPCKALTPIKTQVSARQIWVPAQVEAALRLHACPLWLRLLLVGGFRPEELQALTWEHVDFSAGGIHIEQVAYYDKAHHRWRTRAGAKTASSVRFVPLDSGTMQALQQAQGRPSAYVVSAGRSEGICSISTLRVWFRAFCVEHNLPMIALYSLRHSSITYLLEAGVMVKTVAARAGHSNTATTLAHYAQVTDGAARAAADCFGPFFN